METGGLFGHRGLLFSRIWADFTACFAGFFRGCK